VIAHRGASGTSPENTLVAFRRAVELGADMIELDVQLTHDGAVVVIHDYTLERTTSGTGAVQAHTLADIRRYDAGGWFNPAFRGERVPTLGETLAAVALPLNVELKPVGPGELEARALAAVEEAGALERTVFSSFAMDALERLRARSATAQLAILWETDRIEDAAGWARRVGARALHLRKDAATPRTLEVAAARHLPVRVWTVNDQAEMRRLVAAGVEGIFTDFPERFLQPSDRA
jgi:glycerophosphoryl diester phosphodiesterase